MFSSPTAFLTHPQLPQTLNGDWINNKGIANNRLYAQLCCLAYLQNATHPGNDFKQQIKSLLLAHPNIDVTAMGFPTTWENEPLWIEGKSLAMKNDSE